MFACVCESLNSLDVRFIAKTLTYNTHFNSALIFLRFIHTEKGWNVVSIERKVSTIDVFSCKNETK